MQPQSSAWDASLTFFLLNSQTLCRGYVSAVAYVFARVVGIRNRTASALSAACYKKDSSYKANLSRSRNSTVLETVLIFRLLIQ